MSRTATSRKLAVQFRVARDRKVDLATDRNREQAAVELLDVADTAAAIEYCFPQGWNRDAQGRHSSHPGDRDAAILRATAHGRESAEVAIVFGDCTGNPI